MRGCSWNFSFFYLIKRVTPGLPVSDMVEIEYKYNKCYNNHNNLHNTSSLDYHTDISNIILL